MKIRDIKEATRGQTRWYRDPATVNWIEKHMWVTVAEAHDINYVKRHINGRELVRYIGTNEDASEIEPFDQDPCIICFHFNGDHIEECKIPKNELDFSPNMIGVRYFDTHINNPNLVVDGVGKTLIFDNCLIDSLKFASSKQLYHIHFDNCEVNCGLLSLLKVTSLKTLVPDVADKDFANACNIVTHHLRSDRNVPECQQELIEEGLQQYAKL